MADRRRWLATAGPVTPVLRWAALVHSVPAEQPWRTGCPHCATPFTAARGALRPTARCPGCGQPIGPPAYLLELVTVLAAGLVAVTVLGGRWSPWAAVALAGWAAAAVPLTFIDLAVHRLPDRLTLPAAGWVLAWLAVAAVADGSPTPWLRAALAALACGLAFALMTLVFGARGFGLGDAKLALGAGALLGWLGWSAVVAGLFLAFLGSGLTAAILLAARRVSRRDTLPFGPFLAAGTLAALAWVGLS
ncbi:MAG: prepilin peptidase [Micromonosporaceae bacterium]|nr:prepilin peptidase [Micromonosporaceae bacterium]